MFDEQRDMRRGLIIAFIVAVLIVVVYFMTGCTNTYTLYQPQHDGTTVRTEITMENGIPSTFNEPPFLHLRKEVHFDQTGHFLGGRECEQVYTSLVCESIK